MIAACVAWGMEEGKSTPRNRQEKEDYKRRIIEDSNRQKIHYTITEKLANTKTNGGDKNKKINDKRPEPQTDTGLKVGDIVKTSAGSCILTNIYSRTSIEVVYPKYKHPKKAFTITSKDGDRIKGSNEMRKIANKIRDEWEKKESKHWGEDTQRNKTRREEHEGGKRERPEKEHKTGKEKSQGKKQKTTSKGNSDTEEEWIWKKGEREQIEEAIKAQQEYTNMRIGKGKEYWMNDIQVGDYLTILEKEENKKDDPKIWIMGQDRMGENK